MRGNKLISDLARHSETLQAVLSEVHKDCAMFLDSVVEAAAPQLAPGIEVERCRSNGFPAYKFTFPNRSPLYLEFDLKVEESVPYSPVLPYELMFARGYITEKSFDDIVRYVVDTSNYMAA